MLLGDTKVSTGGGDLRTRFERDIGKVIFSTPFRRLQDKAQVFPLEPMDGIRNRASHSLEVANVAKDLAKAVVAKLIENNIQQFSQDEIDSITNISYVGGLLHDLGNPPFGHAGEDAIKMWFEEKDEEFWKHYGLSEKYTELRNEFKYFDGNAQTLRLVSRLQVVSDLNGLNLTSGSFAPLIKYEADCRSLKKNVHHFSKLGYFQTEQELVSKVREEISSVGMRHPLTFLIEAADDIVYGIADVEDAIKKKVINWGQVKNLLDNEAEDQHWTQIQRELCTKIIGESESFLRSKIADLDRQLIDHDEAVAQVYRTRVIRQAVSAVRDQFIENYESIMNGTYHNELIKDSDVAAVYRCLKKKIGGPLIYQCKEALELEVLGINIIRGLMDIFIKGFAGGSEGNTTLDFNKKIMNLYSRNYRLAFEEAKARGNFPEGYLQLRLLTDYVCGMTDTFALNLYRKLSRER